MDPDASIILVGVRGAGKRTLGCIAATALDWRFVPEDLYFEEATRSTKSKYQEIHGSEAFSRKNVQVTRDMILKHHHRCVLECGWASLTSEIHTLLQSLRRRYFIIHVTRSLEDIRKFLRLDDVQASLFQQVDPYYRVCSTYEYYNIPDWRDNKEESLADRLTRRPSVFRLTETKAQFCAFLDLIRNGSSPVPHSRIDRPLMSVPLLHRTFTHLLPMRLSEALEQTTKPEGIEFLADAVELQIDIFTPDITQRIGETVARLRRLLGVPICYSINLDNKSGMGNSNSLQTYTGLLEFGIRLAVDFIVVDPARAAQDLRLLLSHNAFIQVIAHVEIPLDRNAVQKGIEAYSSATTLACAVARVVYVKGQEEVHAALLDQSLSKLREYASSVPEPRPALVAYGANIPGCEASQVSNSFLTPVCQREISGWKAIPRYRLTVQEAMQLRYAQGQLKRLHIYLIGHVSPGVAPRMFRAGLHATGLAFDYTAQDTIDAAGLERLSRDENFGGASITYGFKTVVWPYVDLKSEHATAIGSVNTLMPLRNDCSTTHKQQLPAVLSDRGRTGPISSWYGDNTDWIGMTVCVQRNLSPRNAINSEKTTGLVVGGGGMSRAAIYAMLRLGLKTVLIFNPGAADQGAIPDHFNEWLRSKGCQSRQSVLALGDADACWPPGVDQPTVIISCPAVRTSGGGGVTANGAVSTQWLQSPTGGVVLEMSYESLNTPILQQVHDLRLRRGVPWVTVNGLEMLTEQGSVQLELITGRRAPRLTMRREAWRAYEEHQQLKEREMLGVERGP